MAEEYVLPQVASEVAKAINKALSSVQTVNGNAPDANGNVNVTGGSGSGQNPNGGLSATAANLLIEILRNGVYSVDQSANITALAAELAVSEPDEPVAPDEPAGSVTVIPAPDFCMANDKKIAYEVGTFAAYFACEPNTNYKVVEHGTHNRFRFYGITDDTFTPSNAYVCDSIIADKTTNADIDSLTEITINSGDSKWIYVYLAADSSVSPNISVTEVE